MKTLVTLYMKSGSKISWYVKGDSLKVKTIATKIDNLSWENHSSNLYGYFPPLLWVDISQIEAIVVTPTNEETGELQ